MVWVPLDSVDGQVMVLVGLKVLSRVGLGAEMDLTLFSTNEEEILLVFVEVEAHTAGEAVHERLLLAVSELLLLVDDELQLDNLLGLKLVLHEVPEGDATIR